jgi:3-methyladenine DNA glycosylase/8-oxoguanine DNA glycosylase
LNNLAEHFRNGQLSKESLLHCNNDSIVLNTNLLNLKGIGQWTYEIFCMLQQQQQATVPDDRVSSHYGTTHINNSNNHRFDNRVSNCISQNTINHNGDYDENDTNGDNIIKY